MEVKFKERQEPPEKRHTIERKCQICIESETDDFLLIRDSLEKAIVRKTHIANPQYGEQQIIRGYLEKNMQRRFARYARRNHIDIKGQPRIVEYRESEGSMIVDLVVQLVFNLDVGSLITPTAIVSGVMYAIHHLHIDIDVIIENNNYKVTFKIRIDKNDNNN